MKEHIVQFVVLLLGFAQIGQGQTTSLAPSPYAPPTKLQMLTKDRDAPPPRTVLQTTAPNGTVCLVYVNQPPQAAFLARGQCASANFAFKEVADGWNNMHTGSHYWISERGHYRLVLSSRKEMTLVVRQQGWKRADLNREVPVAEATEWYNRTGWPTSNVREAILAYQINRYGQIKAGHVPPRPPTTGLSPRPR